MHLVYEAHGTYYAREAAREHHDIEAHDAAMEPETAPVAAPLCHLPQ